MFSSACSITCREQNRPAGAIGFEQSRWGGNEISCIQGKLVNLSPDLWQTIYIWEYPPPSPSPPPPWAGFSKVEFQIVEEHSWREEHSRRQDWAAHGRWWGSKFGEFWKVNTLSSLHFLRILFLLFNIYSTKTYRVYDPCETSFVWRLQLCMRLGVEMVE